MSSGPQMGGLGTWMQFLFQVKSCNFSFFAVKWCNFF